MTNDFFKSETESLYKQPHLLIAAPSQAARNAEKLEKKSGARAVTTSRRQQNSISDDNGFDPLLRCNSCKCDRR
ncbi:hypothetical protein [Microcoleus sp. D2_18a_D3]|uniref:hypothetical protein n=1 Tax=Microcoleus sp. D2_18a_D3 TaxID=3055330 RepID=UPI002FD6D5D9